jgi:hypothetical protein
LIARTPKHIDSFAALCRVVKSRAREFDVSLDPHGGRKIFSKITARGKLRYGWRAEVKLGEFG